MKDPVLRRLVLLAMILSGASGTARAADPLGLYVGAGIGRSEVRTNLDFLGFSSVQASDKPTGWKVMAGIRPLSMIGVEVEYLNFGWANTSWNIPPTATLGGFTGALMSHPTAAALFAVGYLPIPLPHLDLFAKAGATRLKTDVHWSGQLICHLGVACAVGLVPPLGGSSTRFAFGAGAQVRFGHVALRAEYERISASDGDLDILSADVTLEIG